MQTCRHADLHLLRYIVLGKGVRYGRRPTAAENPADLYRTAACSEPVRDWLRGLDKAERQAIGKDLLRAQWVARGYAVVPVNGKWAMGSPDGAADETDSTRAALPLRRAPGRVARVHQETRSTPDEDLATARKRLKELER